jgi:excisionase family DNA binding protein
VTPRPAHSVTAVRGDHPSNAPEASPVDAATAGRLLTADELAARWQLPKSWVYAATRDGRIPAVRLGRYYRYRLGAIESFEAAGGVSG